MASALSNPAAEASQGRDPTAAAAAAAAGAPVVGNTAGLHFSFAAHSPLPAKWNNNSISRHGPPGKGLLAAAKDLKPKGRAPTSATQNSPMPKCRGVNAAGSAKRSKNVNKLLHEQQQLVVATGLSAASATTTTVSCDSNKKRFPSSAPPVPPPASLPRPSSSSSSPSGSGPVCSFRVCEDLLCSSDELRVFTEEGEEEERESGGVRHLQEELEAALFEEKTSLIRETELGLKQEGFFSRLEAGKCLKDADMYNYLSKTDVTI